MKVAIIGGGVSGLSTVWGLNEYSDHDVHLYEAGPYVGGHTNTVRYQPTQATKKEREDVGNKLEDVDVDTGFIVFNTVTYPNFLRFVKLIGVEILDSDMSFAVSRYGFPTPSSSKKADPVRGHFEWAGSSPGALFCQSTNFVNPGHWRMVWDIIRFNNQSLETLREFEKKKKGAGEDAGGSIGEWLDQRGYGQGFRRNYLVPMTASIWSTPPSLAFSSFPAITLLRFMHNHHLLQILNRPQWLTIKGGSHNYVKRVLSKTSHEQIHRGHNSGHITKVTRDGEQWQIRTAAGQSATYDKVVFACHANTALALLDDTLDEKDPRRPLLSSFQFSKNEAVLHSDERLMPVRRNAWSAWNFIAEEQPTKAVSSKKQAGTAHASAQDTDRVSLTYWMNLLQSLPEEKHGHVLVTLNPPPGSAGPREELVSARFEYDHPVYTAQSVSSQVKLAPLQGKDGIYFAGAWLKYGFHEDGFKSGLQVAQSLGASLPFKILSAEREVPKRDLALWIVDTIETFRVLLTPWVLMVLYPTVMVVCFFLPVLLPWIPVLGRYIDQQQIERVKSDWQAVVNGEDQQTWAKSIE